eukprot:Hpha_TRINITY_DN16296_c2_g16::TRINITY_DN16296_c2_g16_i1::g.11399::m.11399
MALSIIHACAGVCRCGAALSVAGLPSSRQYRLQGQRRGRKSLTGTMTSHEHTYLWDHTFQRGKGQEFKAKPTMGTGQPELRPDSNYLLPAPEMGGAPLLTAVELLGEDVQSAPPPAVVTEEPEGVAQHQPGDEGWVEGVDQPGEVPLGGKPMYKTYQPTEVEHFPAAGSVEVDNFNRSVEQYLAPEHGKHTLTMPRMDWKTRKELKGSKYNVINFGHHNGGPTTEMQLPPGTLHAQRFVKPRWQGAPWVPPDSSDTTWDFRLDAPVSGLLVAPDHWQSLPLVEETTHPAEPRVAQDIMEVTDEQTNETFLVQPNQDLDTFPVSNIQRPHHYSKQYGMPLSFQEGPVQWASQLHVPERMPLVEKKLELSRDTSKDGQDMEILCFGDTLTIGHTYGSDEYNQQRASGRWMEDSDHEPREHPYALRLHEVLNCDVTVAAVHSESTDTMRDRLLAHLQRRKERGIPQPKVLILWAGYYDLLDPERLGRDTAQNLMRMHHVAHCFGIRTVHLGLPQVQSKPFPQLIGARLVEVNATLEDFAMDRTDRMCVVDLYKLLPPRRFGDLGTDRGGNPKFPKRASVAGPVWYTNHVLPTPLGSDRIGELIAKRLKHVPGFLSKAIADRFYDHPCSEALPLDKPGKSFEERLYDKSASRRQALAHPDLFGSKLANDLSPYREHEGRVDPENARLDGYQVSVAKGFRNYLRPEQSRGIAGTKPNTPGHEQLSAPMPRKGMMSTHG